MTTFTIHWGEFAFACFIYLFAYLHGWGKARKKYEQPKPPQQRVP